MTIREAFRLLQQSLTTAYGDREARSLARIVFEDAFGVRNVERMDVMSTSQLAELRDMEARLLAFEPVQYILGQADFYGLKFRVDRSVLVPRQETEELVHWILETVQGRGPLSVLDIGAGSGCIPVTLKKKNPLLTVSSVDVSTAALEVAAENARLHEVEVAFQKLDILDEEEWKKLPAFDLIVSNPPYIGQEESERIGRNVLHHEPHLALFVEGGDPLLFYKKIAQLGTEKLRSSGWLFFELNEFNADDVRRVVAEQGFEPVEIQMDINGKERMLRAIWP